MVSFRMLLKYFNIDMARGYLDVWLINFFSSFFLVRFLDTAGMKRSSAYLVNGVAMFFAWLVRSSLLKWVLTFNINADDT